MADVLPSPLEKNMTDVLPLPLENFGLELCFLYGCISKKQGHMLMTKIEKIAIPPARPVRRVSQTGQTGPLH
jgi:hypothetical protein